VSDAPPPGGYQQPGGYQPPPQQPAYQPPPAAPQPPAGGYQQPPGGYQQPQQFQPVNPAPASSSNGCLKAFLIVFAISMVLGIIVVVGSIFLVGKAVDDVSKSFGVADAADYDLPSGDIKCSVDDVTGAMKASGTLTSKKSGRQAYQVKIDFLDQDNTKLGSGSGFTGDLSQNQKGTWDTLSFDSQAADKKITCKVAEVDYSIFSTK